VSPFRLSIAGLAVAAALGVAACGDDDDASDSGSTGTTEEEAAAPSSPSGASVKVVATEFKFSPANPTIDKAGTVTFAVSNAGKAPHALEVEGPNGEVETGTIEPGKSENLKVDLSKAGTYEWYCPIGNHKDQGMKGQINVAGGGSGKAAEDDDEDKDDDKGSTGY
jgi:uncharacterized cupredoxin-like copper-binding protein